MPTKFSLRTPWRAKLEKPKEAKVVTIPPKMAWRHKAEGHVIVMGKGTRPPTVTAFEPRLVGW